MIVDRGFPANIWLRKDVLKAPPTCLSSLSWENIFKTPSRRLDQDEYIRLGHKSWMRLEGVLKTSSSLQNILNHLQDELNTSVRRLQGVLKTYRRGQTHLVNRSSRHLQDVFRTFSRCLQDVFKTSLRRLPDVFKMYHSRNIGPKRQQRDLNPQPLSL